MALAIPGSFLDRTGLALPGVRLVPGWHQVVFRLQNNVKSANPTCSLAAEKTPVMVPPARPAAYPMVSEGYFSVSGSLNVRSPILTKSRRGHVTQV
jgi:hypothetical protein